MHEKKTTIAPTRIDSRNVSNETPGAETAPGISGRPRQAGRARSAYRVVPSRGTIRAEIKKQTGANQVDTQVIDRVAELLRDELSRIVADIARAYAADKDVRAFHRRPNPLLTLQHVPARDSRQTPPHDPDV